LKIGILGAGAMGILYGGLLSKQGNNVKFIVKNETKKKIINDKGIKLNIDNESFIVNPSAILAKEATEFNLIIIFTKTNDTTKALNSIKQIINENTFLMSLQNGLGNLEKLLKFSDSPKIIYGTTMAPADLNNVREVSSFGSHISQFRLADDKNNSFAENILNVFKNAKLNSIINKNVDAATKHLKEEVKQAKSDEKNQMPHIFHINFTWFEAYKKIVSKRLTLKKINE